MIGYVERKISPAILKAANLYPVITVTGPRQSGKTTLVRHLFEHLPYYSLENPDIRDLAETDPKGFLNESVMRKGMVLDEVQRCPQLLSYIQGMVDDNLDIKFVLTGSSNFSVMKSVTQSLSGRTAVFELMPFSLGEVMSQMEGMTLDKLMFNGLYPAVWSKGQEPELMYPNYVKTYLERDVRDLLAVKDLNAFRKFIRLCAARIGSVFNASELSSEIGVSVNTIKSWLSVLEASYIIILLQPFYENTRKRLTKSPKLYFVDTGLACYLLDIESVRQLQRDKMRGHLFENLIVTEALKQRLNRGKSGNMCFYRDSNGNEVDLITRSEGRLKLYEVKSSETFHPEFEKGIKSFCKEFPDRVEEGTVIYAGSTENVTRDIRLINYNTFALTE